MSHPLALRLGGWAAWTPGAVSRADWSAWAAGQSDAADDPDCQPKVPEMPMMARRRLGRMGRMAARVAYDVGGLDDALIVYCSRYGDSALTLSLHEDIIGGGLPSPAGFSMAVHNSFVGVLSIVADNKLPHTAVAAGSESLGAGLFESAMIMAEQPMRRVLLLYCHEPLAPIYEPFRDSKEPSVALALLFEAADNRDNTRLVATAQRRTSEKKGELEVLSFLRFLLTSDDDASFHSAGLRWLRST